MTILGLVATEIISLQVAAFVVHGLVPLFILYNVVSWADLPRREAKRTKPVLNEEDVCQLGKSVWAAWFLGFLVALVALAAISKICVVWMSCGSWTPVALACVGAGGFVFGLLRVLIAKVDFFRWSDPRKQRRMLALLVIGAVAVSITSGLLYYDSSPMRGLIAAAYAGMFVGHAVTLGIEVWK
jgi:hypothetical protein